MALEVATLIYPVLNVQDVFWDSRIINCATWGLDGSLSVHTFLSLFKLNGTSISACDTGRIVTTLTGVDTILNEGLIIIIDNIIKGLSLGEMVLGRVLQYYAKLLKK